MADTDRPRNSQQVVIQMPPELHQQIKNRAAHEDLSMAQTIRRAIREYLEPADRGAAHT
jgi:predicted DNA-binding protein